MKELLRRVTLGFYGRKKPLKNFEVGDTVEVSVKVKEGEKERIQIYKGVVIKNQGAGISRSFTVRKVSDGVGVERTFPYASPTVEKVDVISHGKVRRGKLLYLRSLAGKKARIQSEWASLAAPEATEQEKELGTPTPQQ